ncbi:8990_t:CDS:1 [Ambispora leptoticha]|uniref:8990_t:CDS:1 n=1 Tax=Ambispora leptoticha TaxID=144679 RepID=A0A9N9BWL7_9GLOM|nr:8990_t:CDS:1 [Ambispora leptoticha]
MSCALVFLFTLTFVSSATAGFHRIPLHTVGIKARGLYSAPLYPSCASLQFPCAAGFPLLPTGCVKSGSLCHGSNLQAAGCYDNALQYCTNCQNQCENCNYGQDSFSVLTRRAPLYLNQCDECQKTHQMEGCANNALEQCCNKQGEVQNCNCYEQSYSNIAKRTFPMATSITAPCECASAPCECGMVGVAPAISPCECGMVGVAPAISPCECGMVGVAPAISPCECGMVGVAPAISPCECGIVGTAPAIPPCGCATSPNVVDAKLCSSNEYQQAGCENHDCQKSTNQANEEQCCNQQEHSYSLVTKRTPLILSQTNECQDQLAKAFCGGEELAQCSDNQIQAAYSEECEKAYNQIV